MTKDYENGSRWADPTEIKDAPTIAHIDIENDDCSAGGIPIISNGRTAYVDFTDTHTMIFGSTGSKKTRLFGMPLINILAMSGESIIVSDPKGELYDKTSGLVAQRGYKTVVLNFRDLEQSDCWNPLALPYELYHSGKRDEAISLLNDFLNALAEPQKRGTKDPYWIVLGCSMALAYLLFFIETATAEEANIFNFANFCASNSSAGDFEELSNYIAEGSIASVNFNGILTLKDTSNTYNCIASEISSMLNPFIIRKTLCQVLSKSSFDIRSIGKSKTAIFIIVPDEKTTLHFLITAFIKQTYETLINEAQQQENKKLPVRVNFILDEFANIPAIPDMSSMISAARSRNIRFYLLAQGMRQLYCKYGEEAHTVKGNCDNLIFLTSRETTLLENFSLLCGTVLTKNMDGKENVKPLISVSELQRLSKEKGEALILHGRNYPFVTQLPDIDEYTFKKYPPIKTEDRTLPQIVRYNVDKVLEEIRKGKKPVPFSVEVYGEERFYKCTKPESSDIFDW